MKKKGDFAIGVACAIFAFTVTLQFKSVGSNTARSSSIAARNSNLQAMLYAEQDKNEQLIQSLVDYSDEIDRLRNAIEQPGGRDEELSARVDSLETMSGVSALEGPGISVTMEMQPPQTELDGVAASEITHMDILEVVNELWSSGAEAVSVNGVRLIVSSALETQIGGVVVDNTPLTYPFVVSAIGDAQGMKNALLGKQGAVETFSQWGIKLTVTEDEKIEMQAFKGRIAYQYATVK